VSKARVIMVSMLVCLSLPNNGRAAETVKFGVGFSPNKLGVSTTILVRFHIGTTSGKLPSPVTNVDLRLPAGVGVGTSTLGLAICSPAVIELQGVEGCSPNSFMGFGRALVKVPIGPEIVEEPVSLTILMGPPSEGHTTMLFDAEGKSPVSATLVFPGVLLRDSWPYGAHLNTVVPLTPSVPGAPDAAVINMQSGIGPRSLIYSKHVNGKIVKYRPIGMAVPETCPKGGFPFSAIFSFQDGSTVTSSSAVPCPGSHKPRRRRA
jgi:hypothetical protein